MPDEHGEGGSDEGAEHGEREAEEERAIGIPIDPAVGRLYTTGEAAAYLGVSRQTIRHHVYRAKDLSADYNFAGRLIFTQQNLDDFKTRKRPAWGGRPLKNPAKGPVRPRPKKHADPTDEPD